jgi:hypothetical protein
MSGGSFDVEAAGLDRAHDPGAVTGTWEVGNGNLRTAKPNEGLCKNCIRWGSKPATNTDVSGLTSRSILMP